MRSGATSAHDEHKEFDRRISDLERKQREQEAALRRINIEMKLYEGERDARNDAD